MAPAGTPILDGGGYREAPGTDGPDVAWWFYEDQQYSVKRLIAAAGYPPEEIGFDGITFDQMRPGCWQPQARLDDMTMNHVEASLCLPELPAVLRADLPAGRRTRSWPEALRRGVQRLAGRRVVRGQRRPPDPAVPRPAVGRRARRRRGAPQRRARRAGGRVLRAAAVARAPEHPLRLLGPVLRRVRGDRHRGAPCTSARAPRRSTSSDDAPDAVQAVEHLRQQRAVAHRLPVLGRARALPRPQAALRRGADRLDPLRARARRRRLGRPTAAGATARTQRQRAAVAATTTARSSAASSRTASGVENLDRVGRDNIAFETDYPHQDSTWPNTHQVAKELFGHLDARHGAQDRARQRHPLPRPRGARRRQRSAARVTTLDPAATTVVAEPAPARPPRAAARRARRARRAGAIVADNLVEADLRGVDSHGSAPDGALQRPRAQRSPPPRRPRSRRSTTAARPCASTAASGSGRSPASQAVDLAVERARAHGDRDRVRARDHPPRRARLLHDAGVGGRVLRDGVPERRHDRAAVRRHHGPVLDQPVLVRGARRPTRRRRLRHRHHRRRRQQDPPRPQARRRDDPRGLGQRRARATRPPIPRRPSISQLQWFGGHKGFGIGLLVEIMAGVLADSSFGATEHSESELTGWDRAGQGRQLRGARRVPLPARSTTSARTSTSSSTTCTRRRSRPGTERILVPGELEAERRRAPARSTASRSPTRWSRSSTPWPRRSTAHHSR